MESWSQPSLVGCVLDSGLIQFLPQSVIKDQYHEYSVVICTK